MIPDIYIQELSDSGREVFLKWDAFLRDKVDFTHPESLIHAVPHSERVLLYALMIAQRELSCDDEALEVLAHAAVFHDTRRFDDYLDVGHGARAAVHYINYCKDHPECTFHPESVCLMRYHDLDDRIGVDAIGKEFGAGSERVSKLYSIFKDADALDRWRLGSRGLDPKYLRTNAAREMSEFSRRVVNDTMPEKLRNEIESEVNRIVDSQKKNNK